MSQGSGRRCNPPFLTEPPGAFCIGRTPLHHSGWTRSGFPGSLYAIGLVLKNLHPILLALLVAGLGGFTFRLLNLPLPWLLGAMVFTTLAAMRGLPIKAPLRLRPTTMVVLGLMLGSGFKPEILDNLAEWTLSLSLIGAYLAVVTVVIVPYYRRIAGLDRTTSIFCALPGGITELTLMGREFGGDDRQIALAHASRILIVVCLVALWAWMFLDVSAGGAMTPAAGLLNSTLSDLALLMIAGGAGLCIARLIRFPTPDLLGPMLLSAALHITDLVVNSPPVEIVILAQVLLGTFIGCRFTGMAPIVVLRALAFGAGASVLMLGITIGFATVLHTTFAQSLAAVAIAYAPGGFTEMSLIALALDEDVAYVASHHIVRFALVATFTPLFFRVLMRLGTR
ncbi:AbrB family transcriptional regulator [Tabrizicola sp. WMC-M-20]|nr:AbrB family transcriptional regulator [Tabrizicola sp. WMC-M-20]